MDTVKFVIGKRGQKGSKTITLDPFNASIKLGKRFKPICEVFGFLSKGEVRKVRKALRANGFSGLAAIKRAA